MNVMEDMIEQDLGELPFLNFIPPDAMGDAGGVVTWKCRCGVQNYIRNITCANCEYNRPPMDLIRGLNEHFARAPNPAALQQNGPRASQSYEITNLSIATSVVGGVLTVAIKTMAGTDANPVDSIHVGMRHPALANGTYFQRAIRGPLFMSISHRSTLGQADDQPSQIYVYLVDYAGTLEVAVSRGYFPEDRLVSTTAEGGNGTATNGTVLYSTTARVVVPIRLVGSICWDLQRIAGEWTNEGTQLQLAPVNAWKPPTTSTITTVGPSTYYPPRGVRYLKVRAVGPGGGGGGSTNLSDAAAGAHGTGPTMFGGVLSAGAGQGGGQGTAGGQPAGGAGGTSTLAASPTVSQIEVCRGMNGTQGTNLLVGTYAWGGAGGNSKMGGNGTATPFIAGSHATANSGSGGGGAGTIKGPGQGGGGGGSGGYIEAYFTAPLSSYAVNVGGKGTGGAAGTDGCPGGDGADGLIIVEEFYQ